jgi:hypothetical protein
LVENCNAKLPAGTKKFSPPDRGIRVEIHNIAIRYLLASSCAWVGVNKHLKGHGAASKYLPVIPY